jgi:hypothetical protein
MVSPDTPSGPAAGLHPIDKEQHNDDGIPLILWHNMGMMALGVLALFLLPMFLNSDAGHRLTIWLSDLEPTKSRWKDQEEVEP